MNSANICLDTHLSSHTQHAVYSSSEPEEPLVVPLRQRYSEPRCSGAARLWHHVQHMWTVSQLPPGSDPHQDAGARYNTLKDSHNLI